jgi:hypothetical protein
MSDRKFSPVTPVPNNNMREVLERFRQRRLKSEAVLRALKEQDAAMGFGSFNDMPQLQRSDPQETGEQKSRVDFALKNFTNTLSRTLDFPENPFLDYLAATTTMSVVLAIDHERQRYRDTILFSLLVRANTNLYRLDPISRPRCFRAQECGV